MILIMFAKLTLTMRSTAGSARTHTVNSLIRADDAGVRSGQGHIDRRRETSQQRYAGIGGFLRPNSSKKSGRSESRVTRDSVI